MQTLDLHFLWRWLGKKKNLYTQNVPIYMVIHGPSFFFSPVPKALTDTFLYP